MKWAAILVASAGLTACATTPPPVPLFGDVGAIETLAGRWEGTYLGHGSGRTGTIVFELTAAGDTARGEVVMIPTTWGRPLVRAEGLAPDERRDLYRDRSELLTIEFVRVERGEVRGRLSPYRDPDCSCTLLTTFVGRLEGETIEGTYTSEHEGGWIDTGQWRVVRKAATL